MKMQCIRSGFPLAASLGALALVAAPAHAGVTVTIEEVGGDVVVSSSGTLDLSSWEMFPEIGGDLFAQISSGRFFLGADAFNVDIYASPDSFAGPGMLATTVTGTTGGSGDSFGLDFSGNGAIYLPGGYESGDQLASMDVYFGETLASMGLTAGDSFTWTWDTASGGQDFVTVNIPSPGVGAILGLGALVSVRRRR